jgi:hypothetical protein
MTVVKGVQRARDCASSGQAGGVERANGEVLAPTRLKASYGALVRKVFEMLQHGAICGSRVFGILEASTASEKRLTNVTMVDMGSSGYK